MDVIDRAIENGLHLSDRKEICSQTWKDFDNIIYGKKIVLYGVGAGADCYFDRYKDSARLDAVIDNDVRKQGLPAKVFLAEMFGMDRENLCVSDCSILDDVISEEIVILISSTNYYMEIIEQLEKRGIRNYYVLLMMEANQRTLENEKKSERISTSREEIFARECCTRFPVEEKKIFFRAYGDYADHGKYIANALLTLRKDLDLVWAVSDMSTPVPSGVRKIYSANWKSYIYEMETAKVWILDLAVPAFIQKRQGQLYIQTKHWASVTLKKFYLDAVTFQSVPDQVDNWKRDGQLIDYIITGSKFDEESCRRGFGFEKEVLPFGSPRSDALFFEKENKEKVYQYYKLHLDKHAILYAPTYRFDKAKGKKFHMAKQIELDFLRVKKAADKRFGGEWVIMLRLHPSVAKAAKEMEKPDFVIDVSAYTDSEELVSATDITISDFSSIMFEPAFVKKPVFLFATDLQEYIEKEYELLIPYKELPFSIAESNEQLERNIMHFDKESYQNEIESFLERYGVAEDGHASERTARFLSEYLDNEENNI